MKNNITNANIKSISNKILDLVSSGNYDESLYLLERYNEYFKNNVEMLSAKSIALIAQNNYKAAENVLKSALSLDGSNIDILYNYAVLKQYMGDIKGSYNLFMEVYSNTSDMALKKEVHNILIKIKDSIDRKNVKSFLNNQDNIFNVIVINLLKKQQMSGESDIVIARKNANKCFFLNKPLVSVCVLAYNNLEKYTKACIDCVLKYTTDVDYELVLIDNGSNDETLEYFKSVVYYKKKIIKINENNGAIIGWNIGFKECTSKYLVLLPNDVLVTKNWLSNMIKCAESDDRIGMVAAASDNISNLQNIDLGYTDFEDMMKKAEAYNVSDPHKWEERLRLITAATLFRKDCLDVTGFVDCGFYHDFADDDITFRVRRAGYKAIFCGDTFIHHAGTTINSNQYNKAEILTKGKDIFRQKYLGIDAWEDAGNYELNLISMIDVQKRIGEKKLLILGIDVKCGTPILQLKNRIRHIDIYDVDLSAFSCDAKYYIDLKTICNGDVIVDRSKYFGEHFKDKSFDYILMGMPLNTYTEPYIFLEKILKLLKKNGHLLLKLINITDVTSLAEMFGFYGDFDRVVKSHVTLDMLRKKLLENGYVVNKIINELYNVDSEMQNMLEKMIMTTPLASNKDVIIEKILTSCYLIDIIKK